MRSAVVLFPGSNRDRDMVAALAKITGQAPTVVWHQDPVVPDVDLIVLPGGFSYGDYLRCGAIAARSPAMRDVAVKAAAGVRVLGVCNGFQILTEAGLLPGVLMRNASLRFVCREVKLSVAEGHTDFSCAYGTDQNGSVNDIAGVLNERGNVLGMMPHPENLVEAIHGGLDGRGLFESVVETLAA